jgi:hypothetical protein
MEDRQLKIANLEGFISRLRREERRLLMAVADDSLSTGAHNKARNGLRELSLEIVKAVHAVRKLEEEG